MTDIIFPTLPQGHQRFSVEQLLIELAPALGLRGGRLHALLYMMKQTSPGDWTNPDREPVYFVPQDQTAEALNKTRRALYNDESALGGGGLGRETSEEQRISFTLWRVWHRFFQIDSACARPSSPKGAIGGRARQAKSATQPA